MMIRSMLAALCLGVLSAPVAAQSQTDSATPTIPESQIEPRTVSSPYEFVSAASSADEFAVKAAALAAERAQSPDVKAFSEMLAADHARSLEALLAAGKADGVEIAAPSPDGEQQGLLGKLETVQGADFDRMFVEAQVFVHQRAIALHRGYSEGGSALNVHAAQTLPILLAHYATASQLAAALGTQPAQQGDQGQ